MKYLDKASNSTVKYSICIVQNMFLNYGSTIHFSTHGY